MSSAKQKIRLIGAFAALATLALAISCRGFFVNPTLTGLAVGPSGLTLNVGQSYTMVATGTYSDGSQRTLTSGVIWHSDNSTAVSVDQNSGRATGNAPGSANISAASGGCAACSASTQVNAVLTGVTDITVTPSSQHTSFGGSTVYYSATASNGGTPIDITNSGGVWHIYDPGNTLQDANFTIQFVSGSGEGFSALSTATSQTYTIKVSYPNTTVIGTAQLVIP
jgi:hypothetical protein